MTVHAQLGQILDPRVTETKTPTATFEMPGAKMMCQENPSENWLCLCNIHNFTAGVRRLGGELVRGEMQRGGERESHEIPA